MSEEPSDGHFDTFLISTILLLLSHLVSFSSLYISYLAPLAPDPDDELRLHRRRRDALHPHRPTAHLVDRILLVARRIKNMAALLEREPHCQTQKVAKGLGSFTDRTVEYFADVLIERMLSLFELRKSFIEGIFRIPGLGWYTNVALGRRDYPLILASTLLWTTLISITYFITDIIYALLDPRVAFVKER